MKKKTTQLGERDMRARKAIFNNIIIKICTIFKLDKGVKTVFTILKVFKIKIINQTLQTISNLKKNNLSN